MRVVVSVLVLSVALFAKSAGGAVDYYVSTTGSGSTDTPGTLARPFLKIQQAADAAHAGDNIYIRGGTYREMVTAARSGAAGAPITFQPYRNEHVTVTGLDVLNGGWSTPSSNSTYQNAVTGVRQLFVNGKMMTEGSSSNSSYLNPFRRAYNTIQSVSLNGANSTLTSDSLTSNGSLAGAAMFMLPGKSWITSYSPVTGHTGNTVTFNYTGNPNDSVYAPKSGDRFYITNTTAVVDSPNEWDSSSSTRPLYFNSATDPSKQTVEVRKRELGFDLGSQSYIKVSGLQLKAANISVAGSHNQIDHCQILYPRSRTGVNIGWTPRTPGVTIGGSNNTLTNSEVAYSWGSGVTTTGSSNTINNNVIHDVDWFAGDSAGVDMGDSIGNTISNNTIYNCARSGILHNGATSATITHNDVSRYGVLTADLGGIYEYGTDCGGTVIANNYVHDSKVGSRGFAAGIYLDNSTSNVTVHHNLVTNVQVGVELNTPATNAHVYNNTLWGVNSAMYAYPGDSITNCNTQNNLSNASGFVGSNVNHNLTQTADQFTNSAAGDYTLKSTSSAVNAGTPISGITPAGDATPDVGAFQSGVTPWTAGASFKGWTFGNQTAAPLTAAVTVTSSTVRTTAGSLIAGNPGAAGGTNDRVFIKFDLTNVARAPIGSAVLRLYENATHVADKADVTLYKVLSPWTTSTVDYGQSVGSGQSGWYDPLNLDWYTDIDVTSIVAGWLSDPATNYGFSLRGDEQWGQLWGYSFKSFSGFGDVTAPQLIITTVVPEPSTALLLLSAVMVGLGTWAWRWRAGSDDVWRGREGENRDFGTNIAGVLPATRWRLLVSSVVKGDLVMRSVKLLLVVAFVGISAICASAAFADTILFQDDFEGGTVGALPGPATVGTWAFTGGTANIAVKNAASPGAASGSNYLRLFRPTGSSWIEADAAFTKQDAVGTKVVMSLDMYGAPYEYVNATDRSTTGATSFYLYTEANGVIRNLTANSKVNLTYKAGEWNHFMMSYVIGSSTWDLTITNSLGTSSQTGIAKSGGNGTLSGLTLSQAPTANYNAYFDNVLVTATPEPSSIVLLVSAMLGLVAYAWRKRK